MPFNIQVVVEHSPDSDVKVPAPDSLGVSLGDIELLELSEHPTRIVSRGGELVRIDSAVYRAAAFAIDSAFVPPLRVTIEENGEVQEFQTPALYIPIKSKVEEGSSEMMDLAPLATFPWPWWVYLLVALGFLVLISLLYYLFKKFTKKEVEEVVEEKPIDLDPYQTALAKLKALESQSLTDDELVKEYYVNLSDTLREYLSARFDIPAMEQTSGDLLRSLRKQAKRGIGRVSPNGVDQLEPVLFRSDLVKFADLRPEVNSSIETLANAKDTLRVFEKNVVSHSTGIGRELNPDFVSPDRPVQTSEQ